MPERRTDETYPFTLPTPQGDTLVLRWATGSTIRVWSEDTDAGTPLRAAFLQGATLWNERALFGEYRLVPAASLQEADVVLAWAPGTLPVETGACPPVTRRGTTTFCLVRQDGVPRLETFPLRGENGPGRVRMLVTILREDAAFAELPALVAHELGHVLGLARHAPNPLDLMHENPSSPPTLSVRDAATVQFLYHTRADVRP